MGCRFRGLLGSLWRRLGGWRHDRDIGTPGPAGVELDRQDHGEHELMRTHGWSGSAPANDEEAVSRILAAASKAIDTHGADGVFGPRSREMITDWQRARSGPRLRPHLPLAAGL